MSNVDKKRRRIIEQIKMLEDDLRLSLTKKSSNTVEINVPLQQRRIQELKLKLTEYES